MPTGSEIRRKFLDFFIQKGHREVHSSSLVPQNDPTLLFTNAGMNQFKDVFLGLEKRDYNRATSSQKCVRAGGKHNDLENVGFTNRHHTFFEMLGNFSFGDYFKKDAIAYAWELLTSPEWFNISKEKLYVTIFKGENGVERDSEAYDLWLGQGVPKGRIYEFGAEDNFWQMGDTGPCGPCSEIHYDMGPAASDQGHTDCEFGCECGRYVEIWNLVFMQFNRICDLCDVKGNCLETHLEPLPKPSVDTGAGLERLAAVLQGKISNFDTDLFAPLISRAAELTGARLGESARSDASLRIIADHARATTFLLTDGVVPSNEGRGYVLRKIMRRAMRHARLLGAERPIVLTEMVHVVRKVMGIAYPELLAREAAHVAPHVHSEETRFANTLAVGLKKLDEVLDQALETKTVQEAIVPFLPSVQRGWLSSKGVLSGRDAFKLYDTYGLPLDFIIDAARDRGVNLNIPDFDVAMVKQRERAKASWKGVHKDVANPAYAKLAETYRTEPDFYFGTTAKDCRIEAIVTKDGAVNELPPGAEGEIVLDRTVFYSESGGQVSD